ncbi:hypothetical protein NOMA109596_19205 [Nocardioides marinus]
MAGAAADQQPGGIAAEAPAAGTERGREQLPDGAEPAVPRQREPGPGAPADRGERAQQQVEQAGTDRVPPTAQGQPRLAVAGVLGVHGGGGVVAVAVHQRPPPRQGVPQRCGGRGPAQPVRGQVQAADGGGDGGEGVERAEGVLAEPGVQLLVVAHRSADVVGGLEQQHRPAGVGEQVGRHQAVGTATDDHRVHGGGQLGRRHGSILSGRASPGERRGGVRPAGRCGARRGRPAGAGSRRCATRSARAVRAGGRACRARGWRPPRW